MTKRTIRVALSAAVLAGSTALALDLATGSASADAAVTLPVESVEQVVVDGVHQRVFISDLVGAQLVTTDYAGKVLSTVTGLNGIRGLLLSADSKRLYATWSGGHAIVAFDAATSVRVGEYPLGDDVQPEQLAEAGGKIWFSYEHEYSGHLGKLDLAGAEPVVTLDLEDPRFSWSDPPLLATTAAKPNLLAAADPDISDAPHAILDVSAAGRPAILARRDLEGYTRDIAFSPDGSRLITVNPGGVSDALRTDDLTTVEHYQPPTSEANAVAVRSDGTVAIGVTGTRTAAVSFFTPGTTTPTKSFDLQGTADNLALADRSLAWEPGGRRIFAIGTDFGGQGSSFQVLNDPVQAPVTISMAVPATVELGRKTTVTVEFGSPRPVGLPLVVTRIDAKTPAGKRVGPQTVPAGAFELDDTPTVAGTVTYKVEVAGDETHQAASLTRSFSVGTTRTTTLTLDRNASINEYGSTITVTAHLGATNSSRTVEIWADPYGTDLPNKLIRKTNVDSKGNLTASLKLTRNTTFAAVFPGDTWTTTKTVRSTVYTKASVATAITTQFKIAKSGSTSYYYFHANKNPQFTTAIPPYPGRKQQLLVDVYSGGKWKSWRSGFFELDRTGKSYTEVTGTHAVGVKYRVRSAYLWSKSGDTANYTNYGSYKYFTFAK